MLGQHSREILEELGLDEPRIERLLTPALSDAGRPIVSLAMLPVLWLKTPRRWILWAASFSCARLVRPAGILVRYR